MQYNERWAKTESVWKHLLLVMSLHLMLWYTYIGLNIIVLIFTVTV